MGAPCGGWVEAFGCRGRALLANGGCVERGAWCCCLRCVLGGGGGRRGPCGCVVGATAVRGGLLDEARQLVLRMTGVGRAAVSNQV